MLHPPAFVHNGELFSRVHKIFHGPFVGGVFHFGRVKHIFVIEQDLGSIAPGEGVIPTELVAHFLHRGDKVVGVDFFRFLQVTVERNNFVVSHKIGNVAFPCQNDIGSRVGRNHLVDFCGILIFSNYHHVDFVARVCLFKLLIKVEFVVAAGGGPLRNGDGFFAVFPCAALAVSITVAAHERT